MNLCLNLKMPDGDLGQKRQAWSELQATLFRNMRNALATRAPLDFDVLRSDLETWKPFFTPGDKRRSQWEAAARVLWCAEHAHLISGVDRNQMDHVLSTGGNHFGNEHAGWVWNCTCLLKGLKSLERSGSVPVALMDANNKSLKPVGTIAKLVLDVLRPGTGQLFHHPEDSIKALIADDFSASMQDAWLTARSQLDTTNDVDHCDGRWRVLWRNEQSLSDISGPSAGGAATSGWYHLLNGNSKYDVGVIVLFQVSKEGEFLEVSGIEAKVRAIVQANKSGNRFDKIVVASERNRQDALMILDSPETSHIGVIDINAIET